MSHLVAAGTAAVLCAPLAVAVNGQEPARNQRKAEQAATIAWSSPSVQKIWELARAKPLPHRRASHLPFRKDLDRLGLFEDALRKRLSDEELHALAPSFATMPYVPCYNGFPWGNSGDT